MNATFSSETIDALARRLKEPAWVTALRRQALARHVALKWPHASDDVWRRTDVSLLDPTRGFSPAAPSLLQSIALTDAQCAAFTAPLGHEQLAVRANGAWLTELPQGMEIRDLTEAARRQPEPLRRILEADGFTEAEQKLSTLNSAFHHDSLVVHVPANVTNDRPVRLVHLFCAAAKQAIFPMTVIRVGAGSSLTLIDEYVSVGDGAAVDGLRPSTLPSPTPAEGGGAPARADDAHLINGRIELVLEPEASVHYVRLQRWDARAREFLLQRATLAKGATLTMANLNLGASMSKAHLVTRLAGERASTTLYGFVFGTGRQHVDQHTLQDHQAPHTVSDLQFRAALQDQSHMIYTGLIRIAPQATQTSAYQSNHNLLLSHEAKAETIPMLEILADDVQCKHGASISPIDDEQAFYLMSRGVPRAAAQRLLVMGFVEPIVQQVPFEPLQQRLREEIESGLHQGSE